MTVGSSSSSESRVLDAAGVTVGSEASPRSPSMSLSTSSVRGRSHLTFSFSKQAKSASCISRIDAKRFSGSFSSALSTSASSREGTFGLIERGSGGGSLKCASITLRSEALESANGGRPTRSWNRTTPSE